MGKLNWVPDLGAPLLVAGVDLVAESYAPTYTKWIEGIMTVGGYLGGFFGFGGDFVKNIGIASMPLTARNIYDWAKGSAGASSRLAFKPARTPVGRAPISRWPAPAGEAQFQGVRLD